MGILSDVVKAIDAHKGLPNLPKPVAVEISEDTLLGLLETAFDGGFLEPFKDEPALVVIKCAGLEMRVKKVPRENINILDIDGTVIKTVILRSVAKEIENASRDREAESRNGDSITSSYEALQEEQKHSQHGAGGNEGICHTSAWDTIEKKVLPVGLDLLLRLL